MSFTVQYDNVVHDVHPENLVRLLALGFVTPHKGSLKEFSVGPRGLLHLDSDSSLDDLISLVCEATNGFCDVCGAIIDDAPLGEVRSCSADESHDPYSDGWANGGDPIRGASRHEAIVERPRFVVTFERSEALQARYPYKDLTFQKSWFVSAHDGPWIQLTYSSLRDQFGESIADYDGLDDIWLDSDDEPASDIIISFEP